MKTINTSIKTLCLYVSIPEDKSEFIYNEQWLKEFVKSEVKSNDGINQLLNSTLNLEIRICKSNDDLSNYFASAIFIKGKFEGVAYKVNKIKGGLGERIAYKLSDIPEKHFYLVFQALNEYFGKVKLNESFKAKNIKENYRSCYKRQKDFYFEIARITNGFNKSNNRINNIGYNMPNYALSESNELNENSLNNNILLRSLGEDVLPFHSCLIEYEVIEKAIKALNDVDYIALAVWYFPEQKIANMQMKKEFNKLRNKKESSSQAMYRKAWRARQKAIISLAEMIISIQKQN